MSELPHDLHDSFPQYAEKIDALKASDTEFAAMLADYDAVNKEVYLAETRKKPTDQIHEEELKKKRMHLRDEIYRILAEE